MRYQVSISFLLLTGALLAAARSRSTAPSTESRLAKRGEIEEVFDDEEERPSDFAHYESDELYAQRLHEEELENYHWNIIPDGKDIMKFSQMVFLTCFLLSMAVYFVSGSWIFKYLGIGAALVALFVKIQLWCEKYPSPAATERAMHSTLRLETKMQSMVDRLPGVRRRQLHESSEARSLAKGKEPVYHDHLYNYPSFVSEYGRHESSHRGASTSGTSHEAARVGQSSIRDRSAGARAYSSSQSDPESPRRRRV
ncbi:hypothetical protein SeLEV6574_g02943 [Synchytrium endobioticum]|nr:hypothetical protein SeLEV6574_g02943 [Synchytrium endobioticum]